MTETTWEAQTALRKMLGEEKGTLLSKANIEIRETQAGRIGYVSLPAETFTCNYTQPVTFIEYNKEFYVLMVYEIPFKDIKPYTPLHALRFEKILTPERLESLLSLKQAKFIGLEELDSEDDIKYLYYANFADQAFKNEEDLYTMYAFIFHREEFMRYMLSEISGDRQAFLDVIATEYRYGIKARD